MEQFFKPHRIYAVAGASSNVQKFGHKVLAWYVDRDLPVTPINFRNETILGLSSVSNIKQLAIPEYSTVGLSVVTPPAVSKELLQDVATLNGKVEAIWFQPGTYDDEVIELAHKVVPVVIQDCILINGDRYYSKL
jgi:predicted CoA-binding protein